MTCDMLSAWLLLIIQFLNSVLYFQGYNQYYYISVDAELVLACKLLIFLFLYFVLTGIWQDSLKYGRAGGFFSIVEGRQQ
jgi:hypothetical protein